MSSNYFGVKCPKCEWIGSSEESNGGRAIADSGDFSDLTCPKCETVLDDASDSELCDEIKRIRPDPTVPASQAATPREILEAILTVCERTRNAIPTAYTYAPMVYQSGISAVEAFVLKMVRGLEATPVSVSPAGLDLVVAARRALAEGAHNTIKKALAPPVKPGAAPLVQEWIEADDALAGSDLSPIRKDVLAQNALDAKERVRALSSPAPAVEGKKGGGAPAISPRICYKCHAETYTAEQYCVSAPFGTICGGTLSPQAPAESAAPNPSTNFKNAFCPHGLAHSCKECGIDAAVRKIKASVQRHIDQDSILDPYSPTQSFRAGQIDVCDQVLALLVPGDPSPSQGGGE